MRHDQTGPRGSKPPPAINAPAAAIVLPLLILAAHAAFGFLPRGVQVDLLYAGVLSPERFWAPESAGWAYQSWLETATGLIGSAFLHADWGHVLMNAIMMLAVGAGVLKWTGTRMAGIIVFGIVCLASQMGGAAAHLIAHRPDGPGAVGASGIVSGLVAGALLVMLANRTAQQRLRLMRVQVGVILVGFVVANVIFAYGFLFLNDSGIAWEAHVGGFVAGGLTLWLLAPVPLRGSPLAPTLH